MHSPFADLAVHLPDFAADGARSILLDLGVSSMQIDRPERGFSYMHEGPLDMRMNVAASESAADLVARLDQPTLRVLLRELGEVKRPGRVARAIVEARDAGKLTGTGDLRRAVEGVIGARNSHGELARTFQALRIAVNGELDELDRVLSDLPTLLAPGGVAVVLSYHSLEDRRVKRSFAAGCRGCICPPELPVCACGRNAYFETLHAGAIQAGAEEVARNPRARSVRLRAVRRIPT